MREYILCNDHFGSKLLPLYAPSVSPRWPDCLCWLASPDGGPRCPTDRGGRMAGTSFAPLCSCHVLMEAHRLLYKESRRHGMPRVETCATDQSSLPESILGALPPAGTTTLYDVIAALHTVVEPGEDAF